MFYLALALLFMSSHASQQDTCKKALVCAERLGQIQVTQEVIADTFERHENIMTFSQGGKYLGNLVVSFVGGQRELMSIENIFVAHKRDGWSRVFYEYAIRQYPSVTQIASSLMKDNYEAASGSANRSLDQVIDVLLDSEDLFLQTVLRDTSFDECVVMVQASPSYKVKAELGFTEIVECEYSFHSILLTVRKPSTPLSRR